MQSWPLQSKSSPSITALSWRRSIVTAPAAAAAAATATTAAAVCLVSQKINWDLKEQIASILQTTSAAVKLSLDVEHAPTLSPLVDYAATVPTDSLAQRQFSLKERNAGVRDVHVSNILDLAVFNGFDMIYKAADDVQAVAKRHAVALLVHMLRALASNPTLRGEVFAALMHEFQRPLEGAVIEDDKWATLSARMYRKWDERGLEALMKQMVGEEQLKLVEFKHTRVAAMQMLALLMHHSCVMA